MENCGLWAITSYFNPRHYRRRLMNYKIFRRELAVPLLTVEWSQDGMFELDASDADILIQLTSPDLMWQKERLLSIGVAAVPKDVDRIAWLDGDIVFGRADWWQEALRLLNRASLAQLFSVCHDLGRATPDGVVDVATAISSAESSVQISRRPGSDAFLFDQLWGSGVDNGTVSRGRLSGHGWAGRRELLERHAFYDACILGAGDRAYACAAFGKQREARQGWLQNPRQREHYLRWADPFADAVGGQISLVEGDLFHLWHGDVSERASVRPRSHRTSPRDAQSSGAGPGIPAEEPRQIVLRSMTRRPSPRCPRSSPARRGVRRVGPASSAHAPSSNPPRYHFLVCRGFPPRHCSCARP